MGKYATSLRREEYRPMPLSGGVGLTKGKRKKKEM
jgi:hypothetical protein